MPTFNRFTKKAPPPPGDDAEMMDLARRRLNATQAGQVAPKPISLAPPTPMAGQPTQQQQTASQLTQAGQNAAAGTMNPNVGGGTAPTPPPYTPPNARQSAPVPAKGARYGDLGTPVDNGDGMDDVARARLDQQKERDATAEELRVSKQKALQDASARAGLGGMGLSGAASAQQSDIGRVQDRNAAITMGQLDSRQQADQRAADDQKHKDEVFQAALDQIEEESNLDENNDGLVAGQKVGGKIGDGNPDDLPSGGPPTTTVNTPGGQQTQAAPLDAPVNDSQRQQISGFNTSNIADGAFTKGSKYFGSDPAYDYYQASSGAFYRVKR